MGTHFCVTAGSRGGCFPLMSIHTSPETWVCACLRSVAMAQKGTHILQSQAHLAASFSPML